VGVRRGCEDGTTLGAFISKWSGEAETLRRLGAHVDGAKLIDAILADLHALNRAQASESLTLEAAAQESAYTPDHLGKDSTPTALIVQWRELAEMLRAEGCPEVAATRERCASELETCLHKHDNEALSVNQAANESGYSAEYLRRVLRDTPTLNAGRAGKPLILRRDLPRKPAAALVGTGPKPYDVNADAQSLVSRQGVN
jgi:hypothetical protein